MLEFKVTDQILTRKDNFGVVADSINYLTAKFDFVDSEFGGVITAVFTPLVNGNSYELILTDNSCVVPYEVIKSRGFKVSLYCDINDKRVTTDCVTIPVKESGYVKGETPKEPSPDVYKQLIDIANNAKEIADGVKIRADEGEFKGEKGEKGDNGKDAVTDAELSTESSNAIANKAVANILSSGNLIGIEKISSVEDFEQFQSKYEDVPATDNQYLLLFVTEDIYSGEELTLEKGLIVLTPTDDYKLTCNKEFEEFKKAVEMNFNLWFQAFANYATREKLEQVKTDLLRSIELLQSQTEQKISTTNKNVLQLTARVDELEKEWITVCDDTLTEDISFLLKTTDAQGNPFSFKKLKVYIYSPLNEATGNTGVRIINGIDYSDMDNILVQTSNWFMNTLSQHCVATVDCGGFAVTETNRGPTMDKMNNTGIMGVNFNVESITSVLIRPISTTAKMIPGTRIVVKGC